MRVPSNSLSQSASNQSSRIRSSSLRNDDAGFGVYIHWPFCAAKCPYCDFNSHVREGRGGFDETGFLAAYKAELQTMASLAPDRLVSSIFFGGGTPSLMSEHLVGAIIDEISRLWPVKEDAEITLEANPSSVEADRFAAYASIGVNRVSLGVQSLQDEELKRLGRLHTADEARHALKVANQYFDRVSFDMIYARPGQSAQAWREELSQALELAGGHLSLYQLTIEPGTAYQRLYDQGKLIIPDEDEAHGLFEVTQEICDRHGLKAYEVSNHARPGEESRHNLIYWRYGEYAGVGPGAHSRLVLDGERFALSTLLHPETWRDKARKNGHGLNMQERVEPRAQAEEMLIMGLRLSEGVDLSRLARLTGYRLDIDQLRTLEEVGLLIHEEETSRLAASGDGRLVLNGLISEVASALTN